MTTGWAHRDDATDGPRIVVVGTTGSGKTVLAGRVAQQLGIRHVELDALHWGPDWEPAPLAVFRQWTAEALNGDAWVVDGNYSKVRDITWARAQTVVWLDYPLVVTLARLSCRTVRRSLTHEELWSGNREELWRALTSRDFNHALGAAHLLATAQSSPGARGSTPIRTSDLCATEVT